jgi:hypothetical protein
MPTSKATRAPQRASRACGDPMGSLDNPKWMSEQNVERYRATADECAYRKLNPNIMMVQSAQNRSTENASGCLDGT